MTLVVRTADLARLLDGFLTQNYIDPKEARRIGLLTPRRYLLNEHGISPRLVYRILQKETQWTILFGGNKRGGSVEKILVAIDRVEVLHSRELEVFDVNPATGEMRKKSVLESRKSSSIPSNTPVKKCSGSLCRGQPQPLWEFDSYKPGKGRRRKIRSRCRRCEAIESRKRWDSWELRNPKSHENYNRQRRKHKEWEYYGYVPYLKVGFAVEDLCSNFGPKEAARRIGVSYRALWLWRTGRSKVVLKESAARIFRALLEVREEKHNFHKT